MCIVFHIVILINYKHMLQNQFVLNLYLLFHLKTINLDHNYGIHSNLEVNVPLTFREVRV